MKIIIIILQAILNLVCKRRDLIANRSKIPPEYRDDVVVWYSPKKQRLTNYDVIEAYTEDFKKWNNCPEKYTGSLTSNSLALTNVSQKTALIYSPIKPYDFKVLIRGLQEGQHVKFGFDYGEQILEADKDNSVRDKVANSPRGKELLEKQLNNIRAKKDSIIEEANKELELFKKFQIAAQANPKLTYVDFCNNIKNKEV